MKSILFSLIKAVNEEDLIECKAITKNIRTILVLPFTFPVEKNLDEVSLDFFKPNGRHYEKYLGQLELLGIEKSKVKSINPYETNREEINNLLNVSDAIFIPGGNPEMFMTLAIRLNIVDLLTNYKGVIIGESAGSVLQFDFYPLTAQNNFYGTNSYYNGFNAIKMDFVLDVHTQDTDDYKDSLKKLSQMKDKNIISIYDGGYIIYDRAVNSYQTYGKVVKFDM